MMKKRILKIVTCVMLIVLCSDCIVYAKQDRNRYGILVNSENVDKTKEKSEDKEQDTLKSGDKESKDNKSQESKSKDNTSKDSGKEPKAEEGEEKNTKPSAGTDVDLGLTANSYVLMEASTGVVLCSKKMDEEVEPASITKIMTLLLIFEALESGKITLEDQVTVSEHAASMGGSQVYLEPFETQTVNDMIKCISIASANDACVAMGEFLAGSEEEFVARMNAKAKELGMEHTHFVNCCGLDVSGHYSSALDVALMSRALITNYPQISKYSTVWMDTITHVTKKGSSEFGLTNTNKLVRTYKGITGLKTGSTNKAKYCLSASANRNGMDMIAVVMGTPNHIKRFSEAAQLLDYGFANCSIYTDKGESNVVKDVTVVRGLNDKVAAKVSGDFHYLCLNDMSPEGIVKEVNVAKEIKAPVLEGSKIGEVTYYYNEKKIGSIDIVAAKSVKEARYKDYFIKILKKFFLS